MTKPVKWSLIVLGGAAVFSAIIPERNDVESTWMDNPEVASCVERVSPAVFSFSEDEASEDPSESLLAKLSLELGDDSPEYEIAQGLHTGFDEKVLQQGPAMAQVEYLRLVVEQCEAAYE